MGVILSGLYLLHRHPLFRSRDWSADVQHSSLGSEKAAVFTKLAGSHLLFLELPKSYKGRYKWFVIDWKRKIVASRGSIPTTPYLYFPHDMSLGINLDFPKIEDTWKVAWADYGVTFTNGDLTITVSRSDPGDRR